MSGSDGNGGFRQQILAVLSFPFTACLPSTSTSNAQGERDSLLSGQHDAGGYEDSDAISLLSNIADRSRRRNRASRRRDRWNKSTAALGCGLFGRSKGQIQRRNVTAGDGDRPVHRHNRNASVESLTSESLSVESATSLTDDESVGRFGAASGDEDAGMLEDETIAELSADTIRPDDVIVKQDSSKKEDEEAQRARQAIEDATAAVKHKKELERQAAEAEIAIEEEAARTRAEEARLASEEEAAIAKARRKAERKAAKQGLMPIRSEAQNGQRRRLTEAEAEAAAGGFDFAEEITNDEYDHFVQHHYNDVDQPCEGDYEAYPQQQEVVHHHHYYHEPVQGDDSLQYHIDSPSLNVPTLMEDRVDDQAVVDEDEEDADIAGLGFSKNRRKRADRDGSYASRSNGSGSGSRHSGSANNVRRYERSTAHSGSSSGVRRESAQHLTAESASGSGKQSYRERPRRHERTKSQSTGSGAGRTLREGPGGRLITSPTIPESDSVQSGGGGAPQSNSLSEDRADAAAGGFDDFLVSPPNADNRDDANFSRTSLSPNSSTSGRSHDKRREGLRQTTMNKGRLNAPRNPIGTNIFTTQNGHNDEADEL